MNEDAIRDAYQLFLNNGYRETFDSFKELITSNPDALQDSFTHFQDNGYNDNFDDFKNLMGITTVEEIVQVKKKRRYGIRLGRWFFGLTRDGDI